MYGPSQRQAISPLALEVCPVTGLPIRRDPAWTDVELIQGYSASFCLVGERILVSAPVGNSGRTGIPRFFAARERVLREAGIWQRRHLEIKDYSGIDPHHPRQARVQFTAGMKREYERGMLRGFWGYNGPRMFSWIMKVATRLIGVEGVPANFVADYAAAVQAAAATLDALGLRRAGPRELARRDLELDGLRYGFAVPEPGVVLIETPPRLPGEHLDRFYTHYEALLSEPELFPAPGHRVIVKLARRRSVSWRVRRAYFARTRRLQRRFPCRLTVLVGEGLWFEVIAQVNQRLLPFRLTTAQGVEQALELVRRDRLRELGAHRAGPGRGPVDALSRPEVRRRRLWTDEEIQASSEDLLRFVGSINWELVGTDDLGTERVSADDPLKVVYEAIGVIKADFDSILREKEEMQEQVLHAAKLASLGTLAAGLAHELNNPLTAVLGFAQRLARSQDGEIRSSAEVMIRAAARMQAIVEKLLQTSKRQVVTGCELVEINAVVDGALLMFEQQLRRQRVHVARRLDRDQPCVRGSASHLEGLISNLVANALDAFPPGGLPPEGLPPGLPPGGLPPEGLPPGGLPPGGLPPEGLPPEGLPPEGLLPEGLMPGGGEERSIIIRTATDADWVRIVVTDNGCGMTQQVAARAFDPFFTTKEVGRGTGLGLYVSHMIANEYGGSIALSSEPGRGTTVEVTFPAATPEARAREAVS